MNRQAVLDYAEAWRKEEKIAILRELSATFDYETIAAICEYIMSGSIPQVLPEAAPPSKPRGRHVSKAKAG